jgi:hypothetical protein
MAYEELNAIAAKVSPRIFKHTLELDEQTVLLGKNISSQYALQLYPSGIPIDWEPCVAWSAKQFDGMNSHAKLKRRSTAAKLIKDARALRTERTYGSKMAGKNIFEDMLYFASMKRGAGISTGINEELGKAWTTMKLEIGHNPPSYYPSAETWLPLEFWEFFQQVIAPVVIFSHHKLLIMELIEEANFTGVEVEKALLQRYSLMKTFSNLKVQHDE